ncbi:hypothetical protein Vretimale_18306 [Volvox reticuliferus]|uniref:Uncharacterized protein n=1 Tax=Volvox reticuliferus TaxID=1737510 RepID=A0A8J4GWX0_9CHLO|nr:hypothetical protein Vretimale_18306 [Volvox reticuliferus]
MASARQLATRKNPVTIGQAAAAIAPSSCFLTGLLRKSPPGASAPGGAPRGCTDDEWLSPLMVCSSSGQVVDCRAWGVCDAGVCSSTMARTPKLISSETTTTPRWLRRAPPGT